MANPSSHDRYFLSSRPLAAADLVHIVRSHWQIENALHWSLDVLMQEDYCRVRKDNAPLNLAILRRLALNLVRRNPAKGSMRGKFTRAGWNDTFLFSLLTPTQMR